MIFDKNSSKRMHILLETPKKASSPNQKSSIDKGEETGSINIKESNGLLVHTKKRPWKKNVSKKESNTYTPISI